MSSRNRYNEDAQALARFGEGGEEMTDEITQQTLLPGVKDPNLWMVKCLPGTEKETLLKIMQKYISHEHSDDPNHEPLQIRFKVIFNHLVWAGHRLSWSIFAEFWATHLGVFKFLNSTI